MINKNTGFIQAKKGLLSSLELGDKKWYNIPDYEGSIQIIFTIDYGKQFGTC